MLGSRTKQVYSYGKRRTRIVSDDSQHNSTGLFDDSPPLLPVVSKMRNRENALAPSAKPKQRVVKISSPIHVVKKRFALQSPGLVFSPVKLASRNPRTPKTPLTPRAVNLLTFNPLNPPPLVKPIKPRKPTSLKPVTANVETEITVLDHTGNRVSHERRVSVSRKPSHGSRVSSLNLGTCAPLEEQSPDTDNVAPRRPKAPLKRAASRVISSDSESSPAPVEKPSIPDKKRVTKHLIKQPIPVVILSDDEDEDPPPLKPRQSSIKELPKSDPPPPPSHVLPINGAANALPPSTHSSLPHTLAQEEPTPPIPDIRKYRLAERFPRTASPVPRQRRATPIRMRHAIAADSPVLSDSDLDLSLELEKLTLEALSQTPESTQSSQNFDIPAYVKPLLQECRQSETGIFEFSSFIDTFAFDPIVKANQDPRCELVFRKVGEASYSEVFGIGDVVLKVIPLRDETRTQSQVGDADEPYPTDAKDVLKEVIVTQAMGDSCEGFVRLLKSYVVRGRYPELLLRLWDEYFAVKGSEAIRPDKFGVSQLYAIIVLPNGGPDLEAYNFSQPRKNGWRQACSIFWQVAKALGKAEQLVSFEHRDLHWGQILVKDLPIPVVQPFAQRGINQRPKDAKPQPMSDDLCHGVQATIIDLGLARMDAGDGDGGETIHYTVFSEEIFEGEGDYQFDVYRMMKVRNRGYWQQFNPFTNVMWLHYLAVKLIRSKGLKAPVAPRKSQALGAPTVASPERVGYEVLLEVERWLANSLLAVLPSGLKAAVKRHGIRKANLAEGTPMPEGPSCAGDVVEYGVKRHWINRES